MKELLQERFLEMLKAARESIFDTVETVRLIDESYGLYERKTVLCGVGNEAIRGAISHYLIVENAVHESISQDDFVRTSEPMTRVERNLLDLAVMNSKSILELAIAHLRSPREIQTQVAQFYPKEIRTLLKKPPQASGRAFSDLREKLPSSAYHYEYYEDGLNNFLSTNPQYASFDIGVYFNTFARFNWEPASGFASFGFNPEFQSHGLWGLYKHDIQTDLDEITYELIATVLACNDDQSTLDYPVYRTIEYCEIESEYQFQAALVWAAIVDCFEFSGKSVDLFNAASLINEEYSKLIIKAYIKRLHDTTLKLCLDHGRPSQYLDTIIKSLPELQLADISRHVLNLMDLEYNKRQCSAYLQDYDY